MEPILMLSDALTFLINQKNIIHLIDRMEKITDKLIRENININLGRVRLLSIILISTITVIEVGLVTYNYVMFQDAIWFITLYLGTLGKVFYVLLVCIIMEYYKGINQQLQTTKIFFDEKKLIKKQHWKNDIQADEFGYLHKEILIKRTMVSKPHKVLASDGITHKVVNVIPYGDNNGLYDIKSMKSFCLQQYGWNTHKCYAFSYFLDFNLFDLHSQFKIERKI